MGKEGVVQEQDLLVLLQGRAPGQELRDAVGARYLHRIRVYEYTLASYSVRRQMPDTCKGGMEGRGVTSRRRRRGEQVAAQGKAFAGQAHGAEATTRESESSRWEG